jgi:hypothetical protein
MIKKQAKTIATKMKASVLLFCFLTLTILSLQVCKKDEDPKCGCQGKVVFTIKDSDEQTGFLFKNTEYNNSNIPYFNYGIWYSDKGCSNCVHHFFICNDSFLSNLGEIPPYPGIKVKFSGMAKDLCVPPYSPADYTYNFIDLTKIEKQ